MELILRNVFIHQIGTSPPVGYSLMLSVVGRLTLALHMKWNINCCLCHFQHTEPITTIIGGPDMYIDTGSTINLTCIVKHLPEPPPGIYWEKNGEVCVPFEKTYKRFAL